VLPDSGTTRQQQRRLPIFYPGRLQESPKGPAEVRGTPRRVSDRPTLGVFFKKLIRSQRLIRVRNMTDAIAHQGDKREFQVYYELLSL
jgi:hypothetical protein